MPLLRKAATLNMSDFRTRHFAACTYSCTYDFSVRISTIASSGLTGSATHSIDR